MNRKAIINEAGQQIQTILDDLWANEEISKTDYKYFLVELIKTMVDEIGAL